MSQAKLKFHFQRFEFKYQIPLDLVEGIVPELLKYMDWDPYAEHLPDRAYTVSSLYYDSAGFDCYYQKLAGVEVRKKFRLRYYTTPILPDTPIFFEIKRKYDAVVVKDRMVVPYLKTREVMQDMQNLKTSVPAEQKHVLDEFLWSVRYNGMQPSILVAYKRKPFIGKINPEFRVTIDYQIETQRMTWLDDVSRTMIPVYNGFAILEIKYNNSLPDWFHTIIQKYNLDQRPFSKYCFSLEARYPELAALSILDNDILALEIT